MQLLRKKSKYRDVFYKLFDDELATWLIDEIKLNKQRPMPLSQRQFWKAPEASLPPTPTGSKTVAAPSGLASDGSLHDPRACPSFIRSHINTFLTEIKKEKDGETRVHQPHPNIVDVLRGTIRQVEPASPAPVANGNGHSGITADDNSDAEDDCPQSPLSMDNISEEFQLPKELLIQQNAQQKAAAK